MIFILALFIQSYTFEEPQLGPVAVTWEAVCPFARLRFTQSDGKTGKLEIRGRRPVIRRGADIDQVVATISEYPSFKVLCDKGQRLFTVVLQVLDVGTGKSRRSAVMTIDLNGSFIRPLRITRE